MLMGEYRNSVDEKGRLLLPSRLRNEIAGSTMILTRGVDKCLWLFPADQWRKISESIMGSSSMFKSKTRLLQRRIIAPAQECEIDKAGRIPISPTLRESAEIKQKGEAVILGIGDYIEIWDVDSYNAYLAESESEFLDAAEELGELLSMSEAK
ncbi:MAG TPA: transcriptional regulator MraZ [Sediminispirochaeta sp.]|nr:transcriptional regulator MraZ [Sediminispirochaeta sp.]